MIATRGAAGRRRAWCCAGLLAALLGAGCSPGRVLARQMVRAPNTIPSWLAPMARVEYVLPVLDNHLARATVEVGPPPARLHVRLLAPGDYQTRVRNTHRTVGRRQVFTFRVSARLPPRPWPADVPLRGTVFLLHGYGVSLESMLPWALVLAEAGYQPVLVDLRGHGRSGGKRVSLGLVEIRDLRQVLGHLLARGDAPEPVGALGESYGAALALRWAAQDERVRAVVAFAPYAELEPAIRGLAADYVPWLPQAWVRQAVRQLPGRFGVRATALDTTPFVAGLGTPTLFVAAGEDPIAPPPVVARLARLHAGPTKYLTVPLARHESLPYHFDELRQPVLDWLDAYLRR
jgi:alpha-beta hydrolase superfamily lysophospholipase